MDGSCRVATAVSSVSLTLFSHSIVDSFASAAKFSMDFGLDGSSEQGDELQQLSLLSPFTVSREMIKLDVNMIREKAKTSSWVADDNYYRYLGDETDHDSSCYDRYTVAARARNAGSGLLAAASREPERLTGKRLAITAATMAAHLENTFVCTCIDFDRVRG